MKEESNQLKTILNQSVHKILLIKDDTYKKSFLIQFVDNLESSNIIKLIVSLKREKDIIMCIDNLKDYIDINVLKEILTLTYIDAEYILNTHKELLSSKTLFKLINLLDTNELKVHYLEKLKKSFDIEDIKDFFDENNDLSYYKVIIFGGVLSDIELFTTMLDLKNDLLKLNCYKLYYKRNSNNFSNMIFKGIDEKNKIQFLENNIFDCTQEFVELLLKDIKDNNIKTTLLSKDKGINASLENIKFTSDEEIISFITNNKSYLYEDNIFKLISMLSSAENVIKEIKKIILSSNLNSLVEFITLVKDIDLKKEIINEFSSYLYSNDYQKIIMNSKEEEELLITYINEIDNKSFSDILLSTEDKTLKNKALNLYASIKNPIDNTWVVEVVLHPVDIKKSIMMYEDIIDAININKEQELGVYEYILSVFSNSSYTYDILPNKESVINLFSKVNNLNKDNLIILLNKFNGHLFKVISSENIRKACSLPENQLLKYINLFNKSTLRVDESVINDVLNMSLAKKFANENISDLNIFSDIKSLILSNQLDNKELVFDKINSIINFLEQTTYKPYINFKKENPDYYKLMYEQYNVNIEQTLNNIAQITNFYLAYSKEVYIKNNIESYRNKLETENRITFNSLIDLIDDDNFEFLQTMILNSSVEADVFQNDITLQKCINMHKEYRDPFYEDKSKIMPKDFNSTYRMFNKIMQKLYDSRQLDIVHSYDEVEYTNYLKVLLPEEVVNYLVSIDIDKLSQNFLVEEKKEAYDNLLKSLEKNKILGWSTLFNNILDDFELSLTTDDVSSYITYFEVINSKVNTSRLIDLIKEIKLYSSKSSVYNALLSSKEYAVFARNPSPNAAVTTLSERLEQVPNLIKHLYTQKKITVPPINKVFINNGKHIRIVVGDKMSIDNINQGEKTGSCLRVHGIGSTLLDFIVENENGFHIKFYDEYTGKQISRISGIRNGNSVFFNGLRHSLDVNLITDKELTELTKIFAEYMLDNQNIDVNQYSAIENIFISNNYAMAATEEKMLCEINDSKIIEGFNDNLYFDMHQSNALLLASKSNKHEINTNKDNIYKYDILRFEPEKILDKGKIVQKIVQLQIINQILMGVSVENIEYPSLENTPDYIICNNDWVVGYDYNDNEVLRIYTINTDIELLEKELSSFNTKNLLKGKR